MQMEIAVQNNLESKIVKKNIDFPTINVIGSRKATWPQDQRRNGPSSSLLPGFKPLDNNTIRKEASSCRAKVHSYRVSESFRLSQ